MNSEHMSPELEAKLDGAQTLDDVVRICAEEGITVSREQLEAIDMAAPGGELNEDALDAISGGSLTGWIVPWLYRRRSSFFGGPFGGGGRAGGR